MSRHRRLPALVGGLLLAAACAHGPRAVDGEGPDEDDDVHAPIPIPQAPEPVPEPPPDTRLDEPEDPAPAPTPETAPAEPPPRRTPTAAERAFEAGVRAAARGDLSVAKDQFRSAVSTDPELVWGWYNLGVVLERAGDEAGAAEAWRRALVVDGAFVPAMTNLSRQMVRQGRARDAERLLRQRVREYPANLDLRNVLAEVLLAQGTPERMDAAFAEARQVLSADERNVGALLVLGEVFYRQEKYELAEWVAERVLAIEPMNAGAHNLAGFLHLRQNRRREAFASFRRAAEAGTELPEVYVNYGAFLNQAQDFDQAVVQLEKAVRYAPGMPEARLNLGNAYRGAGRYRKALEEYERVRQLDPENVDVLLNMALVYLDAPLEEMETLARLERAQALLEQYRSAGGADDRLADFVRDAERAIDVERRRIEREGLRRQEEAERARREAEEAFRRRQAGEEDPGEAGSRLGEEEEEEDEAGSRLGEEGDEGTVLGDD